MAATATSTSFAAIFHATTTPTSFASSDTDSNQSRQTPIQTNHANIFFLDTDSYSAVLIACRRSAASGPKSNSISQSLRSYATFKTRFRQSAGLRSSQTSINQQASKIFWALCRAHGVHVLNSTITLLLSFLLSLHTQALHSYNRNPSAPRNDTSRCLATPSSIVSEVDKITT